MSGSRLHEWRVGHGMTQQDLAQRLGVEPNTIARWERDERTTPPFLELALKGILFTHGPLCLCAMCRKRYKRPLRERDPR